jgi:hypothetical protein
LLVEAIHHFTIPMLPGTLPNFAEGKLQIVQAAIAIAFILLVGTGAGQNAIDCEEGRWQQGGRRIGEWG